MRVLALLLLLAVCLVTVGCPPAESTTTNRTRIVDPSQQPVHPDVLAKVDLQYYWTLPLTLNPGERIERLYRLDENLYCITNDNYLIAIDALRGVPKWRYQIADPNSTIFDPVHANEILLTDKPVGIAGVLDPPSVEYVVPFDAVMINTLTHLLVFDRTTGRVVRDRYDVAFAFSANTGGATDGQSFFVGSADGELVAVRPAEAIAAWEVHTDDIITAAPQYFNNHVYAGSEDHKFYAIRLIGRQERIWTQTVGGPITGQFYVSGRGCYVPCEDGRIYAFEPLNGQKLWTPFITRGPCRQPIQVATDTIFQYADDDRLYAIDLMTGQKRWDMPTGRKVLAVMDSKAYVLDDGQALQIVDEMSGQIAAALMMTGFDLFLGNTTAPAIYAATRDGRIYCIRSLDAGHLTAEMLEATPRPRQ